MHVLPPASPGRYRLQVDLVHEHVRWFECGFDVAIDVRRRQRVAVTGADDAVQRLLDTMLWRPELEPVRLPPARVVSERFGHPQVAGPSAFLLGEPDAPVSRLTTVGRTVRLLAAARRPRKSSSEPAVRRFLADLRQLDALVVSGPDWSSHARSSRELWRLGATIAAARLAGLRVLLVDETAPAAGRFHDRLVLALVGRLATRMPADGVPGALVDSSPS
jgi:hypothetical protein